MSRTADMAMVLSDDLPDFRPGLLSVREREVVDLAIQGRTDEQIAQALGISSSTVNSYWVRIRGKVGQHGRTEIVSRMLQLGYRDSHTGLLREVERLTGLLDVSGHTLARSQSELKAERGAAWHLLALHFVPEAVLVAERLGDVVYANLEAERLFHADPSALVGREVCDLTVPEERIEQRGQIGTFMAARIPGRMAFGVEQPSYAQSHDGANFRVTIAVEGFEAPEGFMAVFTVRTFLGDVDAILRSLRKPLVVA